MRRANKRHRDLHPLAEERVGERPVKVRCTWVKLGADHARWEQAFSYDDRTWETNWTADFTRGDPAKVCESSASRRRLRAGG